MADSKNILQRLSAVMAQVEYIKKEKSVSTGGEGSYKAVTHDQVAGMVRGEFVKNGIVIVPHLVEHTLTETGQVTKNGAKAVRIEAVYAVHFINIEDRNDAVVVTVLAHGIDSGDKAPGKVLSYAVKYAILKVLLIETGENDESRYGADDDEDGKLNPDRILEIEASFKTAPTKPQLVTLLQAAREEAKAAGDHYAFKRFTETAGKIAEGLPDVKQPQAKSAKEQPAADGDADGATRANAPTSGATAPHADPNEPKASAGLVKMIEAAAKAKNVGDDALQQLCEGLAPKDLTKSAAAAVLKKLEALK